MLVRSADSSLVVIDVQEKLAAAMAAREQVERAIAILLEAAGLLNIPVFLSEQYPKGLGHTVSELSTNLPATAQRVEKTAFSACGCLPLTRGQVVLAGMEAHVCVLQTAFELRAAGREVFVVADAVCSRTEANSRNALDRMAAAGIVITNMESLLFEWLGDAANEHFRTISKLIR
ncbi:MAG TPA: isochorismatase family protein [Candidatus Limnocylindrales bacterium]|nr:isochorismatase family protein [Candidatus Limnocylindrales bacterium]